MATINVRNLSYSYNDHEVLKDLSFKAKSGEFVIILGRSGSGKSTLLYLLAECLPFNKGEIKYEDKNIGLVFQSPTLLSDFNVVQNIALPLITKGIKEEEAITKAIKVMEQIGILELKDRSIDTLSGGQQARVQIARTLITDPSILLLDEPTGSLDQKNAEEIINLFKKLSKDRLVIMVTHREQLAYLYGTTVYYLSSGSLKLKKKNPCFSNCKEKEVIKEKRVSLKTSFKIGYSFIKNKPLRIFFSSLFLALSLALICCMSTLLMNVNKIFFDAAKSIYNYNLVSVSYIKEIEIEGDTTLIQKTYLDTLPIPYENSYLPLNQIVGSSIRVFNDDQSEFVESRFEPSVLDTALKHGRNILDENEVVANINLAKELNIDINSLLGKTIELNRQTVFETNDENKRIYDALNYKKDLKIVGVVDEIQGLNSSAIYYSYDYIYQDLNKMYLQNASIDKGRPYSVISRLMDASDDDSLLGYAGLFEVEDPKDFKNKLGEEYEVTSFALTYIESSTSLIESIITVLTFFLILILIGSFLLELFTMTTIYEEQKKTLAMFKTFNLSKRNFLTLFYAMAQIFALLTIFLSYLLESLLTAILNIFMKKMSLPAMFSFNIFSISNFLMILITFLLAYVASRYSLTRLNNQRLVLSLAEDIC